jgi:putative two-component system response regulator
LEDKARILIISDSKISSSVGDILCLQGYEVISLHTSEVVLTQTNQNSPDVIIINVTSTNTAGLELIKSLKGQENIKSVPIITITSRDQKTYRKKALATGADDFLISPVDETELHARVINLLKVSAYNRRISNFEKNIKTEVERRTQELIQAFEKVKIASLDTVYRLSRAAEYRDDDVGAHIERMSHYASAIARAMKLNDDFIENILWAAPMHDVGKIGIPDNILRKPGKLDDNEWLIMKGHTTIGSEILKDSSTDFIKLAEEIALSHHEKWNGKGYPRGLEGTDIPLAGRIVAIADVFDALTSARPYKKPFTLEEALSIIKKDTGSHFDPDVTRAFLSIEDEIVKEFNFWQFMSSEPDPSSTEADISGLFDG